MKCSAMLTSKNSEQSKENLCIVRDCHLGGAELKSYVKNDFVNKHDTLFPQKKKNCLKAFLYDLRMGCGFLSNLEYHVFNENMQSHFQFFCLPNRGQVFGGSN